MAYGDIGAVIDSLEFAPVQGQHPRIIHISANVYAIFYCGENNAGEVKTVAIDAAGNIGASWIDVLIFDATAGAVPEVVKVADNVYAVVYEGETTHGYIATLRIENDGTIGDAVIDRYEYEEVLGYTPKILNISGSVFAIVVSGAANDGWLITINIAGDGAITKAWVDSYEFDTANCSWPYIFCVAPNIYAIAYGKTASESYLFTVSIANDGVITKSKIDTLLFSGALAFNSRIVHIAGDTHAIIFDINNGAAAVRTVSIDENGIIGDARIDNYPYDEASAYFADMILISGNVYAISYKGVGGDGWLITISIADDGTITKAWISSLEFDIADCQYSSIKHVSGNIYAIAYQGVDADGFLKTMSIETQPTVKPEHLMMMGVG